MTKEIDSPSRLTLCMIVKNERENLPRCLASAKPYVDEIIVVDTGSNDGTPEIAANYGAQVKYFEWCDDFAAARNYSLSQVSSDWILVLDADEELVVNSKDFREQLTPQSPILAYSLIRTEANEQKGMAPLHTIRLFRNCPEIRYVSRFHEQLKYKNQAIEKHLVGQLESVRILHYGYEGQELLQKKLNRNILILEDIQKQGSLSLMLLYCLAGMYNATEQFDKAQACYVEAFERLVLNLMEGNRPEEFNFVPSLVFTLAGQCLEQKDYETARLLCQRGLEWCPDYPPINYITGFTLIELGFPWGAIAYFKKCIQLGQEGSYYKGEPFELSFTTTEPACGIGAAYIALNRLQDARDSFELALSFDPNCQVAQQNLDRIKQLLAIGSLS